MARQILFLIISLSLMVVACKSEKKQNNGDTKTEQIAEVKYQCPMDCEQGKTYDEAGSCPVCKMDLKPVQAGGESTCSVHEDGNCSCEGKQCACTNCPEHS